MIDGKLEVVEVMIYFFVKSLEKFNKVSCSNHGRKIVDKLTKLSKRDASLEYFTAGFLEFSSTTVKIWFLYCQLGTCHQLQAIQELS